MQSLVIVSAEHTFHDRYTNIARSDAFQSYLEMRGVPFEKGHSVKDSLGVFLCKPKDDMQRAGVVNHALCIFDQRSVLVQGEGEVRLCYFNKRETIGKELAETYQHSEAEYKYFFNGKAYEVR